MCIKMCLLNKIFGRTKNIRFIFGNDNNFTRVSVGSAFKFN